MHIRRSICCRRIQTQWLQEYSTGWSNRQRFGVNASGFGDLCLNLCNGNISLQANISWSAYINIGILSFNKTVFAGGNYNYPERNYATVSSLAI